MLVTDAIVMNNAATHARNNSDVARDSTPRERIAIANAQMRSTTYCNQIGDIRARTTCLDHVIEIREIRPGIGEECQRLFRIRVEIETIETALE
jgi:hypothetical protein